MSRVCEVCGRGPQVGHKVSHAHNVSKRRFLINIQTMRVLVDNTPKRIKVCTRCIQAGKIVRPKFQLRERKPKEAAPAKEVRVVAEAVEEEAYGQFFSSDSIVDVIFKKRRPLPGMEEEGERAATETPPEPEEELSEVERELKTAFIDPEEAETKKAETIEVKPNETEE